MPKDIKVERGRPTSPEWMSDTAGRYWESICATLERMQNLFVSDGECVAAIAQTCVRLGQVRDVIDALDDMYVESAHGVRRHPALDDEKALVRQLQQLLREVGLTPAARKRLGGAESMRQNEATEMDEFLSLVS